MSCGIRFGILLLISVVAATPGAAIATTIIYVDDDAAGANDGSTWPNAYKFLQDALADANSAPKPVEIRVAQGTYRPDEDTDHPNGTGDRETTFQLIGGVTLKGAYAGLAHPDLDERDIDQYETILSGDLAEDDCESIDTADLLTNASRVENCYHAVSVMSTDQIAALDGVTITGGNANSFDFHIWGGGVSASESKLSLVNCNITANSALQSGGGVSLIFTEAELTACTVTSNSSLYVGGGLEDSGRTTILNDCIFADNTSLAGGAMLSGCDSAIITKCRFIGNSASGESSIGGAVICICSSPCFVNCAFVGNRADTCDWIASAWQGGGALHNDSGGKPKLLNCTFFGNFATFRGGAINGAWGDACVEAINCTFVGNSAASAGAISSQDYASAALTNCVLWANSSSQICGIATINYSNIQGGWAGLGNIDADPCFVDLGYWDANGTPTDTNDDFWVEGDYHLLSNSPCINAGDPRYVPDPNETDMDGEKRVMLGRVDMGPDEFNPFVAGFVVVRKERVGRAVFEYDCQVVLENISRFAVADVSLEMAEWSGNMTIIEPSVTFGDTEVGPGESITSVDTCSFTVDRSEPIDQAEIIWRVTAELADTGATMQHTVSTALPPDPQTGFDGLKEIAEKWLWQGTAGGIDEDSVQDGTVNLADFAKFAEGWIER